MFQTVFNLVVVFALLSGGALFTTLLRWQKTQDKAILGIMDREIDHQEGQVARLEGEIKRRSQ